MQVYVSIDPGSFLYARRQLYIYSEIMSIYPFGMCVTWGLGLCQMGHLRVSTLILCWIHTKISIHMCWMNANIFSSKPMDWLQLKFLLVRLNWTQHNTICLTQEVIVIPFFTRVQVPDPYPLTTLQVPSPVFHFLQVHLFYKSSPRYWMASALTFHFELYLAGLALSILKLSKAFCLLVRLPWWLKV